MVCLVCLLPACNSLLQSGARCGPDVGQIGVSLIGWIFDSIWQELICLSPFSLTSLTLIPARSLHIFSVMTCHEDVVCVALLDRDKVFSFDLLQSQSTAPVANHAECHDCNTWHGYMEHVTCSNHFSCLRVSLNGIHGVLLVCAAVPRERTKATLVSRFALQPSDKNSH